MAVTREQIRQTLRGIKDSDIGADLVSLGLVKDIQIEDDVLTVGIELTTPSIGRADAIEADAKERLEALPGVSTANVTVKSQLTVRETPGKQRTGLAHVKNIIAVASGKGGVGKSTVAALLAKDLARRGYKVGLLDTDLYGPSVPSIFKLHGADLEVTPQEMVKPVEAGDLKVMSFGFWLGDNPAVMRGPMVTKYVQQFLYEVQWEELDYLFLDLPPGTGDIQLTITQSVNIDGAVIVTTPQALAYADVGKAVLMFDRVNVPILGTVDNMAYFVCDDCGKRHDIFGTGGAERLAERFGTPIIGQLPLSHGDYGLALTGEVNNAAVTDAATNTLLKLGENMSGSAVPEASYDDTAITLQWPDGESLVVRNKDLRASCQCAVCVDEFSGERKVTRDQIPDDVKPEEIRPLGNYALYIKWSDGHSTGFFPYPLIKEVAELGPKG